VIVAVETIAVVVAVVGGDVGRCCTTVCGNSTNTVPRWEYKQISRGRDGGNLLFDCLQC